MAGDDCKSERELGLLKSLTLSITHADSFSEALDICLREVCRSTGWNYGEALMPSPDNTTLCISNVFSGDHEELKEFYEESRKLVFTHYTGLPGLIWETKQPHWIDDLLSDSRYIRGPLAARFGLRSALGKPVIVDGRMVAVLIFFMEESPKDQELIDLLLAVVSQLGLLFKLLISRDGLFKKNRALRVLSECNQTIIRATDEYSMLQNICRVAVDPGGYRMALVAFAEHDERKSIKVVTHAGFSGNYIERLGHLSWADRGPEPGLSSKVIKGGKPYIVRDISTDPDFLPWKEAASDQGFRSVMSLPLSANHEVIGVLNIYASEVDAFDPEEERLLTELASDTAYAIMVHRTKIEKERIQGQLYQSQKMEAMGQLAAGMAHDFKNILTAVLGYAELISNKLDVNTQLKYNAEQIIYASEKALHLVDDLLLFSRKNAVNLVLVDINQTIARLSDILKQLLGRSIVLTVALAPEQIELLGNENQLEQVLMNIAGNARDAMPHGGSLTIQTSVVEMGGAFIKEHGYGRPGVFACIALTDTGIGMDKFTMGQIFDPFFTTKPAGKGTGLGLSVTYSIVKQHKGYIDVHSEPGQGTTFFIYLPLNINK